MSWMKIGVHFPGNSMEATPDRAYYNADSGMEYEVWRDCDGDAIVGCSHEDVGLTTWFSVDEESLAAMIDDCEEGTA